MPEIDVQTLLEESLPPLPPSTVDPARAVTAARAIRRRRRGLATAAAALAVLAAVPLAFGELPLRSTADQSAADPAKPAGRFDPLVRNLHLGWTPPSLVSRQWETTPRRQSFYGSERGKQDDDGLRVEFLAQGDELVVKGQPVDDELIPVARPTAPVNGRPAWCLVVPGATGTCHDLKWEYAPDAWARVSYTGPLATDEATATALVRRVAEAATFTANTPVRLPFELAGQTRRLHVLRALLLEPPGTSKDPWMASLVLSTDEDSRDASAGSYVDVVGIAGHLAVDPGQNTVLDGKPARKSDTGLIAWNVRGTRVSVSLGDAERKAGWRPESVYRDLRLVANPADVASWVVPS
jgi:hypothetical protein